MHSLTLFAHLCYNWGKRIKPAALSMQQAAAVGVGYVTAWLGVMECARLASGETILVVGGAGAVGTAVTQIARRAGARVIATVLNAAEENAHWRTNVDVVVNLQHEDLAAAALEATGGKGVNVVFNSVGGQTFEPSVMALGIHGRLVAISVSGGRQVSFDLLDFYRQEKELYGLNTLSLDTIACARVLEHLRPGFEEGDFTVAIGKTYPLTDAVTAYDEVAHGARGKVILEMQG